MATGLNYPSLSSLIDLNQLPDALHFLHGGLSSFLNNIYYRNLQVIHSPDGATISVFIELLLNKQAGAEIPGTGGFKLLLNPDHQSGDPMTVIPLSFVFSWGILKYIRGFDASGFTFNPEQVVNLLFKILGLDDTSLLNATASSFNVSNDLTQLAQDINLKYSAGISLPLNTNRSTALQDIATAIQTNTSASVKDIVFNDYIKVTGDDDASFTSLAKLFSSITGGDPAAQILDLLTPYVHAEVELSAGIAVPRSILKPMKLDGGEYKVDETPDPVTAELPQTVFILDIGSVFFDSRSGNFGFDDNLTLNFQLPHDQAQIGNTPLTLKFQNARFRLRKKSGSGSSASYHNRVSIDLIDIGLPDIFQKSGGTGSPGGPHIVGTNIIIDSDDGFSGTIALAPGTSGSILKYDFVNGITLALTSFDVVFTNGSVTSSDIAGTIKVPGLNGGNPFNVNLHLENGFQLDVLAPAGVNIINTEKLLISMSALHIGKQDTVWRLGFAASMQNKYEIPAIKKIFPEYFIVHNFMIKTDGSQTDFDIEAKWAGGASLRGDNTTGLKAYFPINLTSPIMLKGIQINAKANPGLEIEALLEGAGLNIGAVKARVDDLGARIKIYNDGSSSSSGHVGPFNTDISLVGPKGILVEIKAGPVEGTGYLKFGDNEYIGALHLSIKDKLNLNAIGIITTKMPDGTKGFSILVIISAEFPAIQLGFGFTLLGVGGLLGLHRTMKTDVIRAGIKDHSIDHILFPQVHENTIDAIVDDIKQVFPIQKDQFVVGPMLKLGWPTPTLITIEIGVLIELSSPFRIAIVGKVSLNLPDEDDPLLTINVAFLGVIDFDKKYLSFDASIYDSNILCLSLIGDIAVRVFWGDHKEMLLSVGGFHPAYKPEAYLLLPAKMDRLTISLSDGDDFKLSFATYFAVTSNTVQFGARLDLLFKFWKLKIVGYFGFDVLFQFNPFHFISNIYAGLAVYWGSRELLSITLDFMLEGPKPWHATGHASFKVLGFKKTAQFDKTWGDKPTAASIPQIAITPLLHDAIDKSENWQALLPAQKPLLVNLRAWPKDQLVLHPLGIININQKVVPLGIKIQRYGTALPSDGGTYDITGLKIAGITEAVTPLTDSFAPAQYRDMNDDQKLKAASFEYMKSGIQATTGVPEWAADVFMTKEITYDTIIIDKTERSLLLGQPRDGRLVNPFVKGGRIAANAIGNTVRAQLAKPTVNAAVTGEQYKLVTKNSLSPSSTPVFNSLAEALNHKDSMGALSGTVVAVPAYYN